MERTWSDLSPEAGGRKIGRGYRSAGHLELQFARAKRPTFAGNFFLVEASSPFLSVPKRERGAIKPLLRTISRGSTHLGFLIVLSD